MKTGQKGPQLLARVFLNHDLVTDCACVRKGMCLDRLVQEAVKMVASPSHWLTQHTFIALCPSSSLKCIGWHVGPTCLANTCRYQHTHTHTHTHSLSLSLSVSSGVCVHTSASGTESLVGMNSCRFGIYFVLVPNFFSVYKSHINALRVL